MRVNYILMLSVCLLLSANANALDLLKMKKGGSSNMSTTGTASGENNSGAAADLEHCSESLGTIAVEENTRTTWWQVYSDRYPRLGSTLPVLRLMIQQSNCFVVVERGLALDKAFNERNLGRSGELRSGSHFGKGQMVSADYTMSPSIQFAEKGTGGLSGAIGGFFGDKAKLLTKIAGSLKTNEAATTLILVDNRSSVQISAATGSAKNRDIDLFGGLTRSMSATAGGFTNTPEGKVISAAFADSYNKMVNSLRNYKAQQVKGGLGRGGRLKVGN